MKTYEDAIQAIAVDLLDQTVNPEFYSGSAWKAENNGKAEMVAFLFGKLKGQVVVDAKLRKAEMMQA